jgi:hypothetical protein
MNYPDGNVDNMASTADAPAPAPASDVVVARTVIDQMHRLPPPQAAAVARAIQSIGHARGEPIRIEAADIPPDASYFTLVPDDDQAPVIIYRTIPPGSEVRWRVTALVSREDYRKYREAERRGLLDDPTVKTIIRAAGIIADAITVTNLSTVNTWPRDQYSGPGGGLYTGPGGGLYTGPGGGASTGPGGGMYTGPGGGLYTGPGGGLYTGPGGGLYTGPGGGLYTGPGGGLYTGPGGGLYTGPGGGRYTGPSDSPYRSNQPPRHALIAYLKQHNMHYFLRLLREE